MLESVDVASVTPESELKVVLVVVKEDDESPVRDAYVNGVPIVLFELEVVEGFVSARELVVEIELVMEFGV